MGIVVLTKKEKGKIELAKLRTKLSFYSFGSYYVFLAPSRAATITTITTTTTMA